MVFLAFGIIERLAKSSTTLQGANIIYSSSVKFFNVHGIWS